MDEESLRQLKKRIAIEATKIELLLYQLANNKAVRKDEIEERLQEIKEALFVISEDAYRSAHYRVGQLALRRFVPLLLTAIVELGVALVLAQYDEVISKFAALYIFSPLVSALSGNYGLQVASKEIRSIAVGLSTQMLKLLLKEAAAGVLVGAGLGLSIGLIGWALTGTLLILPVLVSSLVAGLLTSAIMGCLMPYFFHRLGFDPAFLVGPFETSIQDLASYFTFVTALLFFSKFVG